MNGARNMPASTGRSRIGMTTVEMGDPAHDPEVPSFGQPAREGDDRPTLGPSVIQRLLDLPHEWLNLARVIEDARNVIVDAFARQAWANTAPISNAAQKGTTGGNAYIPVGLGHPSSAVELRDSVIGTAAAAVVQIVAARAPDLVGSNPPVRLIGTVRTSVNFLSAWFQPVIRLEPEEQLFLISVGSATGTFDFSASYRVLKG